MQADLDDGIQGQIDDFLQTARARLLKVFILYLAGIRTETVIVIIIINIVILTRTRVSNPPQIHNQLPDDIDREYVTATTSS